MEVVLARWWWGRSIHLQKVKQYRQCLLSFPDSSLQYSSCDPVSITHGLGLLLRGAGAGPAGTAAAGPMLEAKLMNLVKGQL